MQSSSIQLRGRFVLPRGVGRTTAIDRTPPLHVHTSNGAWNRTASLADRRAKSARSALWSTEMITKKRKRRRIRLGSPDENHREMAFSLATKAFRQVEKAREIDSCPAALLELFKAQKTTGRLVAHTDAMQTKPPSLTEAMRRLELDVGDTLRDIESRCFR